MIKKLTLLLLVCLSANFIQAQTLEELKTKKAEIEGMAAAKQAEIDAFQGEIDALSKEIEILSGWQTGLSGLLGFNFGGSNNWQANANRNSSSSALNIGVNAFANNIKEKTFWRNNLTANLAWQGIDTNTKDKKVGDADPTGTGFDRNTDVLVGSSLWGYRLNQDIAISALADLNTSIGGFLNPGSIDFGAGVTWTPHTIPNLVVVIHPLTYHFAFSGIDGVESASGIGAKVKATYTHEFPGGIVWSSNLGAFLPYSSDKNPIQYKKFNDSTGMDDLIMDEAGLFEYTWINSLNIANVWKGVGVGITFGIRGAKFEWPDTQTYNAVGLTYGF